MARRHILEDSDEEDDDIMIMEDDDHVGIADNDNNFPSNNNAQQQQYQTSSSQHAQLQQHLVTQAGVTPSNYWLEQCINHVRGSSSTNVSGQVVGEEEACWTQILHADLRDVVRDDPTTRDKSNDNNVGGDDAAAVQLRNAILQSKINVNANNHNNNNNDGKYKSKNKVTLPSSFHLLIQMEEVVDVSMNCEQQLASMGGGGNNNIASSVVGTNNNRGQQYHQQGGGNRNPKHRILKMTFSDGYYSNGKPYPSSNTSKENQILIANETSPIQNLHTTSPPGLKLLLHGPIDVRLGQLQLNDGNCKVIGGEIQSWKEVWQRAKEKAQRTRGLGVDPTIKALCWNSDMGDELLDEVDEGEGESGDVTAAVAPPGPPPVPAMQQQQQPPMQQGPPYQESLNNNQPVITPPYQSTSQQTNSSMNVSGSQNRNQNQMPATSNITAYSSATTSNNASRRAGDTGNNLRQRTLDSYPKKPRPETTRLLPSTNNAPSRPSVQSQITGNSNPYHQRSTNNNNNSNSQANSNNHNLAPMFQQQPQRQQPPAPPPPPPMQNNSNVIPIDDSPPNHFQQKQLQQQQPPPSQRVQSNPYASLRPTSSAAPSNNSSTSTSTPSTSFSSNPSFAELKALLQSLRKDRALYEQYYGKVITVPCKITTAQDDNKEFNIVKAPPSTSPKKKGGGKTKKEKKKYEFLLVGKFLGPKASDGSIAMRVASSVLEPYFDMSAAEIRKLSREDKERANRIVNQCSSTFVHDFSSLQQFQMKLLLTADEFFAKLAQVPASSVDWMVDTGNPFLLVVKKG